MAPRGRNAGQRLAASRRKWKVGDLVLAKVKGFPAWPAKVGEPEKWGLSAESKKVVVCFFGSEQIAFCSPADIEEFTEEKKVSLSGKRHGKGTEFGKAVNQIIECYEKLKKQNEVDKADGSEENIIANGNNSHQSTPESVKSEAGQLLATPEALRTQSSKDFNSVSQTAISAATEAHLHDEEKKVLEKSSDLVITEPSASQSKGIKTKAPSVTGALDNRKLTLRSRGTTTCADTEGLKSGYRRTRSSGANTSRDYLLRRSRRIKKLSDESECQMEDPHDSASDEGDEETDFEIMSSGTAGSHDGRGSVFNSKHMEAAISAETSVLGTEVNDRLDFQTETAIIKKKRMPSRKRQGSDTSASTKFGGVSLDAEAVNSSHNSPNISEKLAQIAVKEDGDEHLPLVKRARLRMGRSSPSRLGDALVAPSMHCHDHKVKNFAIEESCSIKEEHPDSSLSSVNFDEKSHSWDLKKSSMDGEATLPPSKRIHRALEAMSANTTDGCEEALHDTPAVSVYSNNCCAIVKDCSVSLEEKKDSVEVVPDAPKDVGSHESGSCAVSSVDNYDSDAKTISGAVSSCKIDVHSTNNELPKESFECIKTEDSGHEMSIVDDSVIENEDHLQEKNGSVTASDKLATSPEMSPTDKCKTGSSCLENEEDKSNTVIEQMNSHACIVGKVAGAPSEISTPIHIYADANSDDQGKVPGGQMEKKQEADRCESGEVIPPSLDSNATLTPLELSDNGQDQSMMSSVSCEYVDDRAISVTQPSSSATDGASPLFYSNRNLSGTNSISHDDSIYHSHSHLHPENFNSVGKSSSREESLLAFESVVGSLTRTKDSIGRATRMAIDAAKFGLGHKVVEILVCILERESSLHKKVNLFFLVDSIAQCSKTMKGDGAVYPSSVQAMLPRLLCAAAPPVSSSNENHRQCLKVLKVWLERRILPEPILRHHIRELEAFCRPYPAVGSRRPQRNERAFDDPVRQMEGMLVDEYGSNSSIQLPGFCMPPMRCDSEGRIDSDGENSESLRHNVDAMDTEKTSIFSEKRVCILEDVEGELEMEDVAPFCEADATLPNAAGADNSQSSHHPSNINNDASFIHQQGGAQFTSTPFCPSVPQQPLSLSNSPSTFPPVAPMEDLDSKHFLNSQTSNRESRESSDLPKINSAKDGTHHRHQGNGFFEDQMPRKLPDSNNAAVNRPNSHFSGRASSSDFQRGDGFSKSFHFRPPQPSASGQFSYAHEREQSRRDNPPSYYNRHRSRNPENSNFYRHRDRNKFSHRDHSGDYWRPPYPYNSGPCYQDNGRMHNGPPYGGPSREPPFPNNRWNCPPGPVNHRHVNHYNHFEGGPIPVDNRASDYWRPR